MKKILFVLILIISSIGSSYACLNYYYTVDAEGHFHHDESVLVGFNTNFNMELIHRRLTKLAPQLEEKQDPFLLSDYAVYLLKAGQTEVALEILKGLAKAYPDEYKIASNLGTAYELSGHIDSALVFIQRGMELNPEAHEGSEWVHIKILETKKALELDSNYLKTNTVLGLTAEQEQDKTIRNQIMIQVRERFPFTPNKDAIMADVMVDLADCYVATTAVEYAEALYEIAERYYGHENTEAFIEKKKKATELRKQHEGQGVPDKDKETVLKGDHIPIGKIRYGKLLDDNNKQHFEMDWSKHELDIATLLDKVNIIYTPNIAPTEDMYGNRLVCSLPPEEEESGMGQLILLGALSAGLLVVFFLLRRGRRKLRGRR